MQATVRTAVEADIASILPLWRELMEIHSAIDLRFRLAVDAISHADAYFREELSKPASLVAVAECDSTAVGYCVASCRQAPPFFEQSAYGFISEFHVLPAFRRGGVGTHLFEYARDWFRTKDVFRIELVTMNANHDSNAFWERLGCRIYAQRRYVEFVGA